MKSLSIGLAVGAMAALPLLAPSPAHALTACASASSLSATDSCTIVDGGNTYAISIVTDTFANAFPATPSTTNMFWWGDGWWAKDKAGSAASAVGAAFGFVNSSFGLHHGPLFAFYSSGRTQILWARAADLTDNNYTTLQFASNTTFNSSTFTWATSRVVPGGGGNSASVPGPLPVLGVAAAFGFSRKLRKRIKSSTNSAEGTLGA